MFATDDDREKLGGTSCVCPKRSVAGKSSMQLTSTVPLQALCFLNINPLDQILGGGLDLGSFKPILNNGLNAAALLGPELLVLDSHQQS